MQLPTYSLFQTWACRRVGTTSGTVGGGAGGVLVDGDGPTVDADEYDGQGFGAGASGGAGAQGGVVILVFD